MSKQGCLFIVATPIGNLGDITFRALEVLKTVDLIAAEDTRHSQRLLSYYGIQSPLMSLHEYNEQQRIAELLPQLLGGKQVALISDAGTPLISDPGYRLVQAMHQANIRVVTVPGACAAIAALVVSGLATDRFIFEGFLSTKTVARRLRLIELATEIRTIILYEAPHRIEELFTLLVETFGEGRSATLARELSKTFETVQHNTLAELLKFVSADPHQQKGEFVIVLAGAAKVETSIEQRELESLLQILLAELPLKQAVALATKITKQKRNYVYEQALKISKTIHHPAA